MSDYPPPPPPPEEPRFAPPPPPPPSAYPSAAGGGSERIDPLGRELADWGQRAAAFLVDGIIVFAITFTVIRALDLRRTFLGAVLGLAFATAYYALQNGSSQGQTVGKRLLGIQVRDAASGGPIGPQRAAVRYVVDGLAGVIFPLALFFLLDVLWPLWDTNRQALHDKIGGSLVVRVR